MAQGTMHLETQPYQRIYGAAIPGGTSITLKMFDLITFGFFKRSNVYGIIIADGYGNGSAEILDGNNTSNITVTVSSESGSSYKQLLTVTNNGSTAISIMMIGVERFV